MSAPARFSLTRRQRDCFEAIERHIDLCKQSPTSRELAKAMGISCHSQVHHILKALQERGWINFISRLPRSITIVTPSYSLPPALDAQIRAYAAENGDDPADVVADAVALFFDKDEESVAA